MKKTMSPLFREAFLGLVALAVVAGCTKNKELKNGVDPNAYVDTTFFAPTTPATDGATAVEKLEGKTFQLSRGVEEADSENTVGATPGMSDDFGLVRARVTETELQFLSVFDPMGRRETSKIVASYPITDHFDIDRERNDFGEETNKISENKTKPWNQRRYMRVNWGAPSNSLSKFASTLETTQTTEENTTLVEDPKIENGHLSFLVETSVKGDDGYTFVFPMSVSTSQAYRITYRTHLLEVKPNDFKPLPYSLKDFEKFGYFFTQQNFSDPRGMLDKNVHLFANVHNVCEAGGVGSCATNQIRWVLNKGFPEKYKAMARRTIAEWNETFKAALNRKNDVVVLDETTEAEISDPSQNILALYPSRTKSGLLGVAQWISNPETGELKGVRATVYGDGIESVVASVDDMISLLTSNDPLADITRTKAFGESSTSIQGGLKAIKSFIANRKVLGYDKSRVSPVANASAPLMLRTLLSTLPSSPEKQSIRAATLAEKTKDIFALKVTSLIQDDESMKHVAFPKTTGGITIPNLNGVEKMVFSGAKTANDKAKSMHDAERGIHGTDLVEDAAVRYLYNLVKKGKTAKDLENERAQIEEDIAQLTFYTTALHEMGHAFGLRHNFAGSADSAHYAPEYLAILKDIAAKGEKSAFKMEDLDPYASSSIMDYGRDFYSQKAGLGPYDKAAIKYAYNRSIDKVNDPVVKENFKFCTDHMVDDDILCRRFDKGANVTEVTQATIDLYNTRYPLMHYRRGRVSANNSSAWGSPGLLFNSLMTRMFTPVRQVMDELIYRMQTAEPGTGTGYCAMKFVEDSINDKEMANICTRENMEAAGVNPMDLSTFVNALLKHDETGKVVGLMMAPSLYKPNGFADLLYANAIAQDFFTSILGSPEPGTYVVLQDENKNIKLNRLADGAGTNEEKLKAFADDNGITDPEFPKKAAGQVTVLRAGLEGKEYESRMKSQGGWTTNESLGSIWDKYAAVVALSETDLGVRKYRLKSMNGNAYFWPQSKPFTLALFKNLITGNDAIASMQVKMANGQEISAIVPAAVGIDIQNLSTFEAISAMTSETDRSMLGHLQICDINQAECSNTVGGAETIQFRSAEGGNVYRATQNSTGDSIAFELIASAKALDDARTNWIAKRDDSGATQAANLKAIDESSDLQAQILAGIAADPELAKVAAGKDNKGAPLGLDSIVNNVWGNMKMLTEAVKNTDKRFTAIGIGQGIMTTLSKLSNVTDRRIAMLGDAGQCWVKAHPPAAPAALATTTTPVIDIGAELNLSNLSSQLDGKVTSVPQAAKGPGNQKPPGPLCNNEAAGRVLANLLLLKSNFAVASALVTKVVNADVETVVAPLQLNVLGSQLRSKEATIERVRRLSFQVTH